MKKLIFLLFLCLAFPCHAHAFTIDEKLPNKEMEERANQLYKSVRCLVCSGETVSESRSNFAVELRSTIRKDILSGKTDQEILDYLSKTYGNDVLSSTPYVKETYLLWHFPLVSAILISTVFLYKLKKLKGENRL